eukprot:766887-Hanusia_phi.AAC.4
MGVRGREGNGNERRRSGEGKRRAGYLPVLGCRARGQLLLRQLQVGLPSAGSRRWRRRGRRRVREAAAGRDQHGGSSCDGFALVQGRDHDGRRRMGPAAQCPCSQRPTGR